MIEYSKVMVNVLSIFVIILRRHRIKNVLKKTKIQFE